MADNNKKLSLRPRMMYEQDLAKYKTRYNVIRRTEGYDKEQKSLTSLISFITTILEDDNKIPVGKNGFQLS